MYYVMPITVAYIAIVNNKNNNFQHTKQKRNYVS